MELNKKKTNDQCFTCVQNLISGNVGPNIFMILRVSVIFFGIKAGCTINMLVSLVSQSVSQLVISSKVS